MHAAYSPLCILPSNWFWLAHSQIFYLTNSFARVIYPSSTVFCVRTFCVKAVVCDMCLLGALEQAHLNTPIVQKEWGYGAAVSPGILIDIYTFIFQ